MFEDTADFDPGPAVNNLIGQGPSLFFAKYDSSVNLIWARGRSGIFSTGFNASVYIDMNMDGNGNLYITGGQHNTADFNPSSTNATILSPNPNAIDGFIAKYKNNGNLLWVKALSSAAGDKCQITSNAIGESGDIYVTGSFYGSVDFNPGSSTSTMITAGKGDVFIAR